MHTDDAYTILLLCASMGNNSKYMPLNLAEYNQVARALHLAGKRPGALLTVESIPDLPGLDSVRLQWLLDRRIQLGFCLEDWQRQGIWILARSDLEYPEKIRRMQSQQAPPLLFGTGNQKLLENKAIAIFGPDNIPAGRLKKACTLAEMAIKDGTTVIAAGDRKMAKQIVLTMHQHAAPVIWILHEGALHPRRKKIHREAIATDRLLMMAAQSPKAPKQSGEQGTVGALAAVLANELIYVDGSCSKDNTQRSDRFGIGNVARKYLNTCKILHGRKITPEGKELLQEGLLSWNDATTLKDEYSHDPPELF